MYVSFEEERKKRNDIGLKNSDIYLYDMNTK